MRLAPVTICLLPFLVGACVKSMLGIGGDDTRSAAYTFAKPGNDWVPADPGGGDAAWRNPRDGAVIGVNSVCNEEQSRSLQELTTRSLAGLGLEGGRRLERRLAVDGKPALRSDLRGAMSGKPFELSLTVVRTPSCVYDLSFARPAGGASGSDAVYEQLLASFRADGGNSEAR